MTTNDDDGGSALSDAPAMAGKSEYFATAASDPGAFPLNDYVCAAHRDVVTNSLKDDAARQDELRLTVVAVTEQSDNTGVLTMSAYRRGNGSEISVSTARTDGRWKVCDPDFSVLR